MHSNDHCRLNEYQLYWLETRGLGGRSDIVDCEPDTGIVTFANGDKRQACEIYTRVMGYHRPVSSFNIGKRAEQRQRRYFVERPKDLNSAIA